MEYMEGGALTDVIENNTLEEDQISSISLEVSIFLLDRFRGFPPFFNFIFSLSFTSIDRLLHHY